MSFVVPLFVIDPRAAKELIFAVLFGLAVAGVLVTRTRGER